MSVIKEEVKPIDIKAKADLDRLTEKYKDQKTTTDQAKVDPEIINPINLNEIDQEIEMLQGIYQQTTKRNLPGSSIMSYKMGSMAYQKKHGKSPLELLDKYPFMYFVAFGIFIITDIFQHLPKKQPQQNQQKPTEKPKTTKSETTKENKVEIVKPIGATENIN